MEADPLDCDRPRGDRPVPVTATPVVRGKAIDAVYATGGQQQRVSIARSFASRASRQIEMQDGRIVADIDQR